MVDPPKPDPNTTGSGTSSDPLKPDPITSGGGNTQTAAMANNPSLIWPPPTYNGNVRFDVWEAQLDMYISDREITDKPKKVRALLQHIGSEMFEKIIDWCHPAKPQDVDYDELLQLIRDKCTKKKNLFALRVKFFNERQQDGQTLDEYFAHMTRLYGQCAMDQMTADDYGALAVLKGLANDDTRQHLMTLSSTQIGTISKIQELASLFEQGKDAAKEIKGDSGGSSRSSPYSINIVGKGCKCRYCGGNHQRGKEFCPANGKTCSNCGIKDHFAKVCKSGSEQQNMIEERAESMNGLYSVLTVSSRLEDSDPPFIIDAKLNGCDVKMQHDTGSAVSVISKKIWLHIGKPKIYATKIELQSYNRMIPVIGQCNVFVQVGKQIKQQCVLVVSKGKALIGRNWINSFDIRLQRLCNSFIDGKRDGFSNYMQNSQRVIHQIDRRAFKDFDKNSEKKISKAEPMHASMQGKENDTSGKGVKPRNDRLPAEKTHPQHRESTVRKGFMIQEEKHSNYGTDKDYSKSLNRKTYSCCDQADHSHSFKNHPHRIIRKANAQRRVEREDVHGDDILYVNGTVAGVSRRTTSTKQRFGKFNYGHYREAALTGSDEACHVYRDQNRRED